MGVPEDRDTEKSWDDTENVVKKTYQRQAGN